MNGLEATRQILSALPAIKTVESHRSILMKKLGCSSSAELVRLAVREGIAEP
jgi:DNA-binding NarL/FixJ family response regulator